MSAQVSASNSRPIAGAIPSGPKGLPLLGSLPEMGRDTLGFFTACARDYGDVVPIRLGTWPTLLLSNPADIEQVLVRNHENFVKNSFFWRHVTAIFGQGILTSEGDTWRRHRRLIAPAFAPPTLAAYAPVMVAMAETHVGKWRDGALIDLHQEMMALTLRIAAKTLFESEVEEDIATIDAALEHCMEEIRARFVRPVFIPDWVPLPGHRRYSRGIAAIEKVLARMIAERRESGVERTDFLSRLMAARDESGQPLSDRQLRDEAITHLLAGHETTALAMSWTWHLASRHPQVVARLLEEVDSVLGGRTVTLQDIPHLRYTEAVLLESMRLRPPAWGIGREAVGDCEIGGAHVPAGTTIFLAPWVVQRDPRWFDDPESFTPERWLDGLERRLPRFAYFPFGGGPRICIGQKFAMTEAILMLATIANRFTLEWQPDRPIEPFPSITLRPKGGVWVKVRARDTLH